jgi:hypothetical protein
MNTLGLSVKRSQSDRLFQSKIISPNPIKKSSRISLNVAREVFDLPSSMDDLDNSLPLDTPNFIRAKVQSLYTDMDSSWGSDSIYSNSFHGDNESPTKINIKNPLLNDEFEEISMEMVPRTSNPIVHDKNFIRCDQEALNLNSKLVSRC